MKLFFVLFLSLFVFISTTSLFAQTDTARNDSSIASVNPLTIGHDLAKTTFAGFRYGSNPARKQVDCSQFMQAVVERVIGRQLNEVESRAVLIAGVPGGAKKLDSLIDAGDDRITGVQYALTKVIPIGRIVSTDSAQPGDMIQYWIKSSSGHYKGHTAIIETLSHENGVPIATLYGSHKTVGRIGTAVDRSGKTLRLKLSGRDRRVYLVRVDPELLSIFLVSQLSTH